MHVRYTRMTGEHDFSDFDLNLLRVLDALLRCGSVTRAAEELGLTQSGTSRALKRLRVRFNDPLLVRDGRKMVPTAVARQLAGPVSRVLADVDLLFVSGRGFEPATARWTVRIASDGYTDHLILPRLLARAQYSSPNVQFKLLPVRHAGDALSEGRVDAVIGPLGSLQGSDLVCTRLYDEEYCCAVREGHPAVETGLDLETFLSLEHVLVTPGGEPAGVSDLLYQHGKKRRRVRAQVASFTAPLPSIAASDRAVILPFRFALGLVEPWRLVLLPIPVDVGRLSVGAFWLARRRNDAAHRWFRRELKAVALDLSQISAANYWASRPGHS